MQANKRPLIIGITGNIGSGKSFFCSELESQHQIVVYADRIAQKYLLSLKDTWIRRWGTRVLNGTDLDRAEIARIVFNSAEERRYLNAQIHPLVLKELQDIVDTSSAKALFFEIPLLFEAGLQLCFDLLVLIQTDTDTIIQRVQTRDHSDAESIRKRLDAQIPDAEKAQLVDIVIDNSGSIEALRDAALKLIQSVDNIEYRQVDSFQSQY